MENIKVWLVVLLIRFIYAGMQILSKAAFNDGMSVFVFLFYRQFVATLLLVPIAFVLERIAAGTDIYSIALSYTSATLSAATMNVTPVATFILAIVLGMETVKLKRYSGIAKVSGVVLCLSGILAMAFYRGPQLKALKHHPLFGHGDSHTNQARGDSKSTWILGTFLMILSNFLWSLWILFQEPLLKEYPSKLLFTTLQCVFSTIQSFFIALTCERDFSRWKLSFDISLISVAYCGIIVTGVSFYLQTWTIEKRGPVFFAMTMPFTLIITIIGSAFLLGELISLGSVLGAILMVGGLYSVLQGKRREHMDSNLPK
ncbi:WAT1-related protein At5g64700 isoform X2 [Elaeis guineensis]|uniref:WAT1-related protein n=1 Tax=Elaeis guineensis var. tenera TaxID=51953 RepID=A0A6J0PEZ1_ELAGV|nr:WAT1-related protein At5g64700 isoform X2 [Elaeis guineensis]